MAATKSPVKRNERVSRYDELPTDEQVHVDHVIAAAYRDHTYPWRSEQVMHLLYVEYKFPAQEIARRMSAHARALEGDDTTRDAVGTTLHKWVRHRHEFDVRPGQYYHVPEDERDEWLEDYREENDEKQTGMDTTTCPFCGEDVLKLPNHLPCDDVPADPASSDTDASAGPTGVYSCD